MSGEVLVCHRVDVDGALRGGPAGSFGVDAVDEGVGARGAGDGDEHAERNVVRVWGGIAITARSLALLVF